MKNYQNYDWGIILRGTSNELSFLTISLGFPFR